MSAAVKHHHQQEPHFIVTKTLSNAVNTVTDCSIDNITITTCFSSEISSSTFVMFDRPLLHHSQYVCYSLPIPPVLVVGIFYIIE